MSKSKKWSGAWNKIQFKDLLFNTCLFSSWISIRLVNKPVTVSVVSSNPTAGKFIFLRHLDASFVQKWQKCQICFIYKNLDCCSVCQVTSLVQLMRPKMILQGDITSETNTSKNDIVNVVHMLSLDIIKCHKSTDWPPNYHKILIFSPPKSLKRLCAARIDELADSKEPANYIIWQTWQIWDFCVSVEVLFFNTYLDILVVLIHNTHLED